MNNRTKAAGNQGIKEFRREIALLKRKGLIDKKYDARSVTPTKYLKSQVKKFSDVLTGGATPVKVNKQKAAYYKGAGYTVKNGRVVVPHLPNEKVYGSRGNFAVKVTTPSGSITRTDRAIAGKTIAAWEEGLKREFKRLKTNERLSFQIGDNFSEQTFPDIESLLFFLNGYKSMEIAQRSGDPNEEEKMIQAIVIYKFDRGTVLPKNTKTDEQIAAQKAKRAEAYQKYVARRSPEAQEQARQERKEAAAKYRANLTPEEKKKANEKSRERAKKSYTARIAKNGKKNTRNN